MHVSDLLSQPPTSPWIAGVFSVTFDLLHGQSVEWGTGIQLTKREEQRLFVHVIPCSYLF